MLACVIPHNRVLNKCSLKSYDFIARVVVILHQSGWLRRLHLLERLLVLKDNLVRRRSVVRIQAGLNRRVAAVHWLLFTLIVWH